MSTRHLSEISMLVDLNSTVWEAITLPPSFGQHSIKRIAADYEKAVDDLPRPLLDAVLNGKYRTVFPPGALSFPEPTIMPSVKGLNITTRLDLQVFFLHSIVNEVRLVSNVIENALLRFDWTKWRRTQVTADADPFYFVGIDRSCSKSLTPWGVQLLRSMIRLRTACDDWRRVSSDFEDVLEVAGQIVRGERMPAVHLSDQGLRELDTQKSAWESAFHEITVEWFGLLRGTESNDFISWDRKRRQERKNAGVKG